MVAPTPVTIPLKYQPLVNEAALVGSVRVIVGLNVGFQLESALDASQIGAQRAAIQGAQAGILTSWPTNYCDNTNGRCRSWPSGRPAGHNLPGDVARRDQHRARPHNTIALDNATMITGGLRAPRTAAMARRPPTPILARTQVTVPAPRVVAEACFSSDGVVRLHQPDVVPQRLTQQIGPGVRPDHQMRD